jgi:hypothetical protein
MAEAAAMMNLLLFAADVEAGVARLKQVTPLSPTAKVVGSILGVVVAGIGIWLWLAHRAQSGKPEHERGLGARLRWRTPIALLLALCGVLVEVGVWIDPTKAPGAFVAVWLLVMLLLTVTMVAAGVDWWWVARLATWHKQELIHDDRERLFDELSRRRDPPRSNGTH